MKSIARIHYSFLTTVALAIVGDAFAGSATWKAHPATNDWNAAANWTPQIVPNSPSDIATFIDSDKTSISLSAFTDVDRIVFEAGANAFTIKTDTEAQPLRIFGAGIINNSGVTQNFVAPLREGRFNFVNSSTAGSDTVFTMESSLPSMGSGGQINFFDSSSADHGTFLFAQSTVSGAFGGEGSFFGASTAAHSTFIVNGGASSGAYGAIVGFGSTSTAGQGTFTISGGTGNNAGGGTTAFLGNSTAGNATLIANGGSNGGLGGCIFFEEHSYGGEARVELFGNGKLDLSEHGPAGITLGSIEGDGRIFLGANDLTVGRNNLSTKFSGLIRDGGFKGGRGGSLTKRGTGTLVLTDANTYTGGTIVERGALVIKNRRGSGTGPGPVQINRGRLGGAGIIAGPVTIGIGSEQGAFLSPGVDGDHFPLTIQSELRFNSDGNYSFGLDSSKGRADKIIANGVTIVSGAQFHFSDSGNSKLTRGRVLTAISNTSASAIAGTFANLSDGLTFTQGANTYRVNYEGGGGNDLTLTVQ